MLIMYLCVDLLGWNDMVMKLASNVIVVILNYILSKSSSLKKKRNKAQAKSPAGRKPPDRRGFVMRKII